RPRHDGVMDSPSVTITWTIADPRSEATLLFLPIRRRRRSPKCMTTDHMRTAAQIPATADVVRPSLPGILNAYGIAVAEKMASQIHSPVRSRPALTSLP